MILGRVAGCWRFTVVHPTIPSQRIAEFRTRLALSPILNLCPRTFGGWYDNRKCKFDFFSVNFPPRPTSAYPFKRGSTSPTLVHETPIYSTWSRSVLVFHPIFMPFFLLWEEEEQEQERHSLPAAAPRTEFRMLFSFLHFHSASAFDAFESCTPLFAPKSSPFIPRNVRLFTHTATGSVSGCTIFTGSGIQYLFVPHDTMNGKVSYWGRLVLLGVTAWLLLLLLLSL